MAERLLGAPAWGWALGVGILYGPAALYLESFAGVPYARFAESAQNILQGVVIPLWILVVVLAAIITVLGWWRPILWDDRPAPRWLLVIPAAMVVLILIGISYPRIAALDTRFLLYLTLAVIAVGFCEEIVYRGIALVGFRQSFAEWQVWLFSTLLFGMLHLWNYALGQPVYAVLIQFCLSFIVGSGLYITRRVSGTILVPMLLHAAWDWMTLSAESTASTATELPVSPLQFSPALMYPIVVVVLIVGWRALFHGSAHAVPVSQH